MNRITKIKRQVELEPAYAQLFLTRIPTMKIGGAEELADIQELAAWLKSVIDRPPDINISGGGTFPG